jgi:hypothetical protein
VAWNAPIKKNLLWSKNLICTKFVCLYLKIHLGLLICIRSLSCLHLEKYKWLIPFGILKRIKFNKSVFLVHPICFSASTEKIYLVSFQLNLKICNKSGFILAKNPNLFYLLESGTNQSSSVISVNNLVTMQNNVPTKDANCLNNSVKV